MKAKYSISVIGVGRLGGALAIALAETNFNVETLTARSAIPAQKIVALIEPRPQILDASDLSKITSDIILIATQDSEIQSVSKTLAAQIKHQPFVFHTSGALSSEILTDLKLIGCQTGSIHPLLSVSDSIKGARKFKDAYFCIEGDEDAVKIAELIVERLNGKSFSIATEYKTLYHAAAVTSSGHVITLIDAAIEMLSKCGLPENKAREILLPLIKSSVENLEEQTTDGALTGTFARADVETLARHLDILQREVSPQIMEIYLQIGTRSLDLARRRGANSSHLNEMQRQILLAKKHLK